MRRAIFVFVLANALLLTASAGATPNFPSAIQSELGAPSAPQCTACHNNPSGGLGTVTTRFGMYMRSRGLVAFDVGSLQNALAAARGEMHVSNDQGISDIDALTRGLDPNSPMPAADGGSTDATQPQSKPEEYGCVGSIAQPRPKSAGSGLFLIVALVGLALVRRHHH